MPEEAAPEVLVLWNGVICESGSLVAFLTHEAEAKISRLDHVNVISTITNGKSDLSIGEFLHKADNLSLLAWGGSVNNDRLGIPKQLATVSMHENIVESNCDDHSRNQYLIIFKLLDLSAEPLDFFEEFGGFCVGILEHYYFLA